MAQNNTDIDSGMKVILPYLARDPLYKTEKPYATDFDVSAIPGAKNTNHVIELVEHTVYNARALAKHFILEENGFEFLKSQTCVDVANCDDEDLIYTKFRVEIEAILHEHFPYYKHFRYLDHQVRKRSALFPGSPGEQVRFAQPASLPHTDFTTRGGFLRMAERFPKKVYCDEDFDLINIWTVLKGPNNDWPLAVCDFKSINSAVDCIPNDILHDTTVGENGLLYHDDRHRWYYLADQETDDLIVFRNANSLGNRANAYHAAFNTGTSHGPARQSIEIRFACFR
ncbi:hypothetical protein BKA67DRAFT_3001 [Truncatella angustata]|uniref:CmcJ-like methyltransferase n=1 Tax=Truncatella angustata TaxID=152316 RepID=A0A9P8UTQ2_9PEZI|nr:uncharacterized protein BKA67DRAFT_3001 [Truncatella angustata]KAH6658974.1 hypothetical protein BKA67DRAFT_3001 [Truncatella angustata]KAH8203219.1 hypothetical protein TruAng_002624 [Truncatella angustata]